MKEKFFFWKKQGFRQTSRGNWTNSETFFHGFFSENLIRYEPMNKKIDF